MSKPRTKSNRRKIISLDSPSESSSECRIPRWFMQTWKNGDVPDKWKDSPSSVREKMRDWNYILMTDEMNREFVRIHFPDFLATYDAFPYPIQRVDAIRYMWLYINGGIYMDLDIVLTRSIEDFFTSSDCQVYLVHSGNIASYYTNALMASKPGSPFWLECIEEMKKKPSPLWVGRHLLVMNTTGPMMLTRVAKRSNLVIATLPSRLLVPCSLCDLPCEYNDDIYAYAIPGSSWVTWDTLMYNFFFCHWKTLVLVFVILFVAILIFLLAWWLRPRCM